MSDLSILSSTSNNALLSGLDVALIFLAFFLVVFVVILSKKIYFRIRYKKRYFIFPKMGVKGIANVAMVISISIVTILLLTIVTAGIMAVIFRAYPGWRVTIEGILIKVGGLLFGPIIGVFIGAATDLLSVALTAGAFHYGYFIAAMMYGLIAGVIRSIWNFCHENQVGFTCIITFIALILLGSLIAFVYMQPVDVFVISIFALNITLTKWMLALVLVAIFLVALSILWICMIVYNHKTIRSYFYIMWFAIRYKLPSKWFRTKMKMGKNKQWYSDVELKWYSQNIIDFNNAKLKSKRLKETAIESKRTNWFSYFAPVLAVILLSEGVIEIIFLPAFDVDFSVFPFDYWLAFRSVMFSIMFVLNLLIIYPVYRIVCPAMHYKYQNDLIEDLSTPLVIQ